MNKWLLLSLLILCLLNGCRENSEIISEISTSPESIEALQTSLSGTILDENKSALLSAKVEVLQEDESLGSAYTKPDGTFEIPATILPDKKVFLRAEKDGYLTTLSNVDPTDGKASREVVMAPSTIVRGSSAMEGRTSQVILIEGILVGSDGTILSGKYVMIQNAEGRTSYSFVDTNGAFSVAVPANEALTLLVLDRFCRSEEFEVKVGPFGKDTDLGRVEVTGASTNQLQITGQLVSCAGNPVANGIVEILAGGSMERTIADRNGNFEVSISECSDRGNSTVTITAYDENYENAGDAQRITLTGVTTVVGPIEVCTRTTTSLELTIGDSTYTTQAGHQFRFDEPTGMTYFTPLNPREGLILYFPGNAPGTYAANTFAFIKNRIAFIGGGRLNLDQRVVVEVRSFSEVEIAGTISGTVLDAETRVPLAVTGTFKITQ
ncbi:MAG: carboxypeptidase-like regulatory domain-containing protein [Bacteroidota bacterium]